MSQLVVNSEDQLEHNLKAFQMTSKDFKISCIHISLLFFCFCFYLSSEWECFFKISTKKNAEVVLLDIF